MDHNIVPSGKLSGMQCSQIGVYKAKKYNINHEGESSFAENGSETLRGTYTDIIVEVYYDANIQIGVTSKTKNDNGDKVEMTGRIIKNVYKFDEDALVDYFEEERKDRTPWNESTCYRQQR